MNESEFKATLVARGYGAPEVIERPADLFNPEHTHDFSAAALVIDGEITVVSELGSTTCRAGDHFELAGGITHTEQYGPQGAKFLIAKKTEQST